jgi:hypothetical protein
VIGVVLLAALLLLTLAVYFALWTKTFASEERKDHRAEDLADAIVSQYPDGDAFDAALQKHVAPPHRQVLLYEGCWSVISECRW